MGFRFKTVVCVPAMALAIGLQTGPVVGQTADSVRIQNAVFHGIRSSYRTSLVQAAGICEGDVLPQGWPDSSLAHIIRWYLGQGHVLARIDSIRQTILAYNRQIRVEFWISEGPCLEVGELNFSGITSIRLQDLVRRLDTRPGEPFEEQLFEKDVERILDVLEDRGRPLASVAVAKFDPEVKGNRLRVDIGLNVDEGPLVRLADISVSGNTITKTRVILRETRLKIGKVYSRSDLAGARDAVRNLGFFETVSQPIVDFMGDRARVRLDVKDGNTTTLDGVLGYTPAASENAKGYWTGRLQFLFSNLFGTGRLLEAFWEKKDAHSQVMRLAYEEPWIFGIPVHTGGRFRQEVRDTSYVEREWRLSVRTTPRPGLSIGVEIGRRDVLPDSAAYANLGIFPSGSWLASIGFDYNTLDDPLNPSRGVRYQTNVTAGRKKNSVPDGQTAPEDFKDDVSTRSIQAHAEALVPIVGRTVFYTGLHGMEVRTGDPVVPVSDQIRFGGFRTVRGYTEDAFQGNMAAWANMELRFLAGQWSRAFVFLDGGYYQRKEETGRIQDSMIGYGVGIRIETRVGVIGIDYGLGENDTFATGKVHVGLVNRF